jgi:hypothetical protein
MGVMTHFSQVLMERRNYGTSEIVNGAIEVHFQMSKLKRVCIPSSSELVKMVHMLIE